MHAAVKILAVLMLCAGVGLAAEQKPRKPDQPHNPKPGTPPIIKGKIIAVGEFTLTVKAKDGDKNVQVSKDATIKVDGKNSEFSSLKVGMDVTIMPNHNPATSISATSPPPPKGSDKPKKG